MTHNISIFEAQERKMYLAEKRERRKNLAIAIISSAFIVIIIAIIILLIPPTTITTQKGASIQFGFDDGSETSEMLTNPIEQPKNTSTATTQQQTSTPSEENPTTEEEAITANNDNEVTAQEKPQETKPNTTDTKQEKPQEEQKQTQQTSETKTNTETKTKPETTNQTTQETTDSQSKPQGDPNSNSNESHIGDPDQVGKGGDGIGVESGFWRSATGNLKSDDRTSSHILVFEVTADKNGQIVQARFIRDAKNGNPPRALIQHYQDELIQKLRLQPKQGVNIPDNSTAQLSIKVR
jgi:outer membrane biosynthesis protein TonB